MKLMPSSKARSTQATARSRATPTPNVSQEPNEISETLRSLEPSLRYFMFNPRDSSLKRNRLAVEVETRPAGVHNRYGCEGDARWRTALEPTFSSRRKIRKRQ